MSWVNKLSINTAAICHIELTQTIQYTSENHEVCWLACMEAGDVGDLEAKNNFTGNYIWFIPTVVMIMTVIIMIVTIRSRSILISFVIPTSSIVIIIIIIIIALFVCLFVLFI